MRRSYLAFALVLCLATALSMLLQACDDQSQPSNLPSTYTSATAPESIPANGAWPGVLGDRTALAADLVATNYLVLLDNSGSMNEHECSGSETKFDVAKREIARFVDTLRETDNLALATFVGSTARIVVPFGSGTEQRRAIKDVLTRMSANERTPLYSSLVAMFEVMTTQAQRQLGYGTFRLVPVTDGESTDSDPGPIARKVIDTSPVEIHAIGFCTGGRHSLNIPGVTRFYTANSPGELAEGLRAVQAEVPSFDANFQALQ